MCTFIPQTRMVIFCEDNRTLLLINHPKFNDAGSLTLGGQHVNTMDWSFTLSSSLFK